MEVDLVSVQTSDGLRLDGALRRPSAAAAGFRRVALWGRSLGAVKTIYYLAKEQDERVVCAVTSSPPRFCHSAYLAAEQGAVFKADIERARELVVSGRPDAFIQATIP